MNKAGNQGKQLGEYMDRPSTIVRTLYPSLLGKKIKSVSPEGPGISTLLFCIIAQLESGTRVRRSDPV
jgi:hypothetical protein